MHDIDARVVDKLNEVAIILHFAPTMLLCLDQSLPGANVVSIAQADQARPLGRQMAAVAGNDTKSDKCARKLV